MMSGTKRLKKMQLILEINSSDNLKQRQTRYDHKVRKMRGHSTDFRKKERSSFLRNGLNLKQKELRERISKNTTFRRGIKKHNQRISVGDVKGKKIHLTSRLSSLNRIIKNRIKTHLPPTVHGNSLNKTLEIPRKSTKKRKKPISSSFWLMNKKPKQKQNSFLPKNLKKLIKRKKNIEKNSFTNFSKRNTYSNNSFRLTNNIKDSLTRNKLYNIDTGNNNSGKKKNVKKKNKRKTKENVKIIKYQKKDEKYNYNENSDKNKFDNKFSNSSYSGLILSHLNILEKLDHGDPGVEYKINEIMIKLTDLDKNIILQNLEDIIYVLKQKYMTLSYLNSFQKVLDILKLIYQENLIDFFENEINNFKRKNMVLLFRSMEDFCGSRTLCFNNVVDLLEAVINYYLKNWEVDKDDAIFINCLEAFCNFFHKTSDLDFHLLDSELFIRIVKIYFQIVLTCEEIGHCRITFPLITKSSYQNYYLFRDDSFKDIFKRFITIASKNGSFNILFFIMRRKVLFYWFIKQIRDKNFFDNLFKDLLLFIQEDNSINIKEILSSLKNIKNSSYYLDINPSILKEIAITLQFCFRNFEKNKLYLFLGKELISILNEKINQFFIKYHVYKLKLKYFIIILPHLPYYKKMILKEPFSSKIRKYILLELDELLELVQLIKKRERI